MAGRGRGNGRPRRTVVLRSCGSPLLRGRVRPRLETPGEQRERRGVSTTPDAMCAPTATPSTSRRLDLEQHRPRRASWPTLRRAAMSKGRRRSIDPGQGGEWIDEDARRDRAPRSKEILPAAGLRSAWDETGSGDEAPDSGRVASNRTLMAILDIKVTEGMEGPQCAPRPGDTSRPQVAVLAAADGVQPAAT